MALTILNPNGIDMASKKISSLLDPVAAQDAATKNYVDALFGGLDWKASVWAATTTNITLSGAQTIDGVSVIATDRVLVKNQSTGSQNGIYVAAAGAWSRASDADVSAEVTAGMVVPVAEGTANGDKAFILTTNDPITLATTALVFAVLPGAGGGSGYATVQENAGSLTQRAILNFVSGLVATDDAGNVRTNVDIDTALVVRKFASDIGDGSTVAIVVTHSLGTRDVTCQVYRTTTPWDKVECDVEATSTTTVTLRFAVAPTTNQFRAVIHA